MLAVGARKTGEGLMGILAIVWGFSLLVMIIEYASSGFGIWGILASVVFFIGAIGLGTVVYVGLLRSRQI